jgi:hypothetical protein
VATIWDPVLYLRSGARQHMSEARELQRQTQASSEAGNPVAAAVQAGAAEGHKEVALELVRAAEGEPSQGG